MSEKCERCGGEGKAGKKGDTLEGAEGEMARASAFVWATKGSSEERLRTKLAELLAEVRAEGVAQGRAAFGKELEDFWRDHDSRHYRPMSRRDEFVRTAMVCLAIAQQWEDDRSFGAEAIKLADDVLAALDGKEE